MHTDAQVHELVPTLKPTTSPVPSRWGRWRRRLAWTFSALAGTWLVLAWRSGAFLSAHDVAVAEGDWTDDGFSSQKVVAHLPSGPVAYLDVGQGPPLVLLHGCPFSAYEWKDVLPALSQRFRVIVPDLRGLGDTPVALDDDYRLPTDVTMVQELMDHLHLPRASFVAHDHGGATLQLLMAAAPDRIDRAVLSNAEAYDGWPSGPELPYLRMVVNPLTSPLMYHALQLESARRRVFSIAVHDRAVLTPGLLQGWTAPHVASPARWQRLRRFYRSQLDPAHNRLTADAVPAMRRFDHPVLLVWGARDTNFGTRVANRLARDLPNTRGIVLLQGSSHMPMQEEPTAYAAAVLDFLERDRVPDDAVAALRDARGSR